MLRYSLVWVLFLTNLWLAGGDLALGQPRKIDFYKYEVLYKQLLEEDSFVDSELYQKKIEVAYSNLLEAILNDLDNLVIVEYLFGKYVTHLEKNNYAYMLNLDFNTKKKALIVDVMAQINRFKYFNGGFAETKSIAENLDLVVAQAYDLLSKTSGAAEQPKKVLLKPANATLTPAVIPAKKYDLNNLVFLEDGLRSSPMIINYEYLTTTALKEKQDFFRDIFKTD